jgi:hypothetical protein
MPLHHAGKKNSLKSEIAWAQMQDQRSTIVLHRFDQNKTKSSERSSSIILIARHRIHCGCLPT